MPISKLDTFIHGLHAWKRYMLGMVILIFFAVLDFATGPILSAFTFYIVPIIYFGWYLGKWQALSTAYICAALWLISDLTSGQGWAHPLIPYWNAMVHLIAFLITSYILIRLQSELIKQKESNLKLKAASDEIFRLSVIKSEFVSVVSHELRTPLTVIKESAGIVRDGSAGPINDQQKDFLDTAVRNAQRLARLINDVLDFQKLEAGKMDYAIEKRVLNEVVNDIGSGFALVARRKGLGFEIALGENLPEVLFDRDKIAQVLTNLLSNAIKFSASGRITLRTESCAGGIRVSVSDQGTGIEAADIPNLFQSFSQFGPAHQRPSGGTGLGLAISRKIIEDHGGRIGVESSPGKGSVFFFILKEPA